MKLLELFSSYYPFAMTYHRDEHNDKVFTASFKDSAGKDVEVEVTFIAMPNPENDEQVAEVAIVSFMREGREDLSGDGREVAKLFGTVIRVVDKVLATNDFDVVTFGGDTTQGGRVKLYKHLVDRFAEKYHMKKTAPKWLEDAVSHMISSTVQPFFLSR